MRTIRRLQRLASLLLAIVAVLLVADSAFLITAATPDGLVVPMQRAHVALGAALCVLLPLFVGSHMVLHRAHRNHRARQVGLGLAAVVVLGCVAGAGLWAVGKSGQTRWLVLLHEGAFVGGLAAYVLHRARAFVTPALAPERVAAGVVGLLVAGIWAAQLLFPQASGPAEPAVDVLRTGLSRARTLDGHTMTAQDLRTVDYCAGCHEHVAERWEQSAHRFSSLNNPFYTANVRRLQGKEGNEAAAFCGGCHDPVLLLTGRIGETLEAGMKDGDAGIPCLVCHAVVQQPDRVGNGGYVLARPDHYPGYGSDDPEQQELNRRLIRSKPAKHTATFGHPWLRGPFQCLTCHKAHLPPELTGARWHRGQDDFDPWHDSGAGGFSGRTFYAPGEHKRCQDCHMPRLPSDDPGAKNGTIADHAFPGANTTLAATVGDAEWVERSRALLDGVVSVDIAAATSGGQRVLALDDGMTLPAGRVELDVVVRNRASGHLFPGGVADLREAWLEVTVEGPGGPLAATGWLDAQGVADPGAHRWHTVLLDREGNWLRLHDVEDTWTVLYSNRIMLGASDLVRVAFDAPAAGEFVVRARALHRKFDRNFLEFALGEGAPRQPIVVVGADELRLGVGPLRTSPPPPDAGPRLRDLGIGHLLRGDTGLAREAARAAAERLPNDPGPLLDLARAALRDGDLAIAEAHIRDADQRQPGHPTAAWLLARVRMGQGDFEGALTALDVALARFPMDRELLALRGRLLLKAGRTAEARVALEAVLVVDPEHVGAHSHLARACAELGDDEAAARHLAIWERLRPDAAEKTAVEAARQADPYLDRRANPQYVLELAPPPAGWAPATTL